MFVKRVAHAREVERSIERNGQNEKMGNYVYIYIYIYI